MPNNDLYSRMQNSRGNRTKSVQRDKNGRDQGVAEVQIALTEFVLADGCELGKAGVLQP